MKADVVASWSIIFGLGVQALRQSLDVRRFIRFHAPWDLIRRLLVHLLAIDVVSNTMLSRPNAMLEVW